jgi:hypothetical protein
LVPLLNAAEAAVNANAGFRAVSRRVGNPGSPLFQSSFSITFLNVVP